MVKIVVLDGYTLNPGDLSWKELEKLGDCTIYDRTSRNQVIARSSGARIVLTNKTVLDAGIIADLDTLGYIGVLATGYNVVDIRAAALRAIPVTNVPGYASSSVAQHTFALLLELALHTGKHAREVRNGKWAKSRDFSWWDAPLLELEGLTMGIVGFGSIGGRVARIARSFGMRVLAHTPHPEVSEEGVRFVSIEELFTEADVVSLHSPLTEANAGFVNAKLLSMMKSSAFLLNTARGGLINEADLAAALNAGAIAGAGLDVLSSEPPHPENPLLSACNCVITPHIAWASVAARRRLLNGVVKNVKAFFEGKPENVVNAAMMPGK